MLEGLVVCISTTANFSKETPTFNTQAKIKSMLQTNGAKIANNISKKVLHD
jgi:hypothetical protein